ncbi:MAG: glycoside hydrolase family 16 protein [Flaviaesturariibacter sp.]|nr:glycoside hydrolase family 16 protein [Flaviaesturariibacter sp.]
MKIHILVSLLILTAGCKKGGSGSSTTPSKVAIDDISQAEGNSGTSNFELKVTLDHASSTAVTVTYQTVEGTAKAGEDFTAVSGGTISFQPNEVEKKIVIPVVADDLKESDETFTVVLSAASNASIQRSISTVTIINDDTRVAVNNNGFDAPTSYPGYTLAWSDEFNGASLNTAYWSNQNGDGCPNLCGWGNNELEYYTDRPDNLFFQDGKLIIEAKNEAFNGKQYTSSKILTAGKKTFKFGRIDIRAQLPKGKGIWPALWLLPQDNVFGGWPRSGEIDLMELVGHEPNKAYGTLHFGPGPGSVQISRGYTLPNGTFNDEFHVFSIEWKQDQIKFFVDNNLYSTVNKTDLNANTYPFNEQFYLIFNLAVGGQWPGNPDATTTFPQRMIVDYVRVYQ